MLNDQIIITLFNSIYDKSGTRIQTTFAELCEGLKVPQTVNVTKDEYDRLSPEEKKTIKFGSCYCPATFDGDIRKGAVNAVGYLIVLDADHPTDTLTDDLRSKLKDIKIFMHTTFSSTEKQPRYRLLIPLTRTVNKDEYKTLCQGIEKLVNCTFDNKCYDINQPMLFPKVPKDVSYHYDEWGYSPLDADALLGGDTGSEAETITMPQNDTDKKAASNEEKQYGWIQAWCDAHPVRTLMDEDLKEVYEPTGTENRYKYRGADSAPGVIVDEKKNIVTSFHDHDPASGRSYNSFDLYRIHKFGHLDKDCADNTPQSELPSFRKMMNLIKKDKKARKLFDKHLEQRIAKDDPDAAKILRQLQRTAKGEIKISVANTAMILLQDPALSGIVWDSFFGCYKVTAPLPWESGMSYPHPYTDHDRNATISYISKKYETEVRSCFDTALSEIVFARVVNPLKEYFQGLEWDGISRVESLLTTYLGCEPSEYVKAAIRVTLVGAVRRVFEPGCKFETVLLIIGSQGCGKSTFANKLGMSYFTDSLRLQDIANKTAAEKLRGVLIAELGEMAGYSKADIDMFKSFISCNDDQYREPYAKCKSSHPRTCIFIGTSNRISGLLTDETGNRRFLPVYTTDDHTLNSWDMTSDDVDQIWAEAYHMYQSGTNTEMPRNLMDEIKKMQDGAVVEDDRTQFISQYLDVLLPEDWYSMDIMKRRNYINHEGEYAGEPYTGTKRRKYVCTAEIATELFNLKKIDITPRLSKDIALMLRKLGWTDYPYNKGRKRIPGYGVPITFCRPSDT